MGEIYKSAADAVSALKNKRAAIEKILNKGMEKALLTIEADAKKNCPVDEGRLRASITHDMETEEKEVHGRVGTNVDYAAAVECGSGIYAENGNGRQTPWIWTDKDGNTHRTKGQKPARFMQRAIDSNRNKLGEIFKETMEGLR